MDDTKKSETAALDQRKPGKLRQAILLLLLAFMVVAFFYDKYVLLPSAEEKIGKIMNDVSRNISDKNREEISNIIGFKPSYVFEHKGVEVEQYRFPRAIPFILKRPPLDIAYKGDAIAMLRQEPITKEAIDAEFPGEIAIDYTKKDKGTISEHVSPTGM